MIGRPSVPPGHPRTDPPRVSVAIATFDGGRFVAEQVESILSQSVPVDEIVLGDDGSTDGTPDVVAAAVAGRGIDLVILPSGGRLGVTANFERTLRACTGDFVLLSDQDDVWHEDRVARTLDVLVSRPEVDMVFADARVVDEAGRPAGYSLWEALAVRPDELRRVDEGAATEVFLRRNLATGATCAVRRTFVDAAVPFPGEWVHDEWLAVVAAARGGLVRIDAQVIDYRQHGSNQIGVDAPGVLRRLRRMLEPRGTRNVDLAIRGRILADRLEVLDGAVPAASVEAAAKARFESARARLPSSRLRRIPGIARLVASGDYPRFASQGFADIARDLVQPS